MKDNLKNIITLTLNPAFDLHIRITDGKERIYRRDSGGKGINVSRDLRAVGVENLCAVTLGREDTENFLSPLLSEGLDVEYVTVDGKVRENKNIQEGDTERVIKGSGAEVDGGALDRLWSKLMPHITEGTALCFSGSIPAGSDKGAVISLLTEARYLGARLILDSASLSAEDITLLRPYMVKPNREEAEALLGKSASGLSHESMCLSLLDLGAQYVLLTLGKEGMLLGTGGGVYGKTGISILPVSTTGAGDSATAGFVAAKHFGLGDKDTLRLSLAFATAACLTEGTLPPDPCQIKRLFVKACDR